MDIHLVKNILDVLHSVGIEEAVLEPAKEGTLIRGANKDLNVIVFHTIPDVLVEKTLGIQSIRGLLSRLQLFDTTKASIALSDDGNCVVDIVIKQGRKKASYKCASPSNLMIPKKIPGDLNIVNKLVFERAYVDHISQAVTAMSYTGSKSERNVTINVKDNIAEFSIYDGEDDTFTDEVEVDFPDMSKQATWDVAPFQRVLKQSLDANNENAIFTITEFGIAVFDLSIINVLVAPITR